MAAIRNVRPSNVALDLINAAISGDLKQLSVMLDEAKIDINATAIIKLRDVHNLHVMNVTALSAAAAHGKVEVVIELLKRGASVVLASQTKFHYPDWSTHALICYVMCNMSNDHNFQILHLLLQNTKQLLPYFASGYATNGMIDAVQHANPHALPFIWLEAIARNDINAINEFITKGVAPPTLSDFKMFVFNCDITVQLATNISNTLSYMVSKKILASETAFTFTKLAESNITFLLELDSFPMELREYLGDRAKATKGRSLQELFAEFRSLFCPDENLPRVPVDSDTFSHMDQTPYIDPDLPKEKSIERIRALQNSDSLPELLKLDQVNIMIRLGACKEETGDNPAALLLAEILLFKHKEMPKFTDELQKKCLRLLTKLYSLTDFEKILLQSHKSQSEGINVLQSHNIVLAAKLDEVQKSFISLAAQNENILSLLLAKNVAQKDSTDPDISASLPPAKRPRTGGALF